MNNKDIFKITHALRAHICIQTPFYETLPTVLLNSE